jgi:predicted flap endonuclease-1-like 5' DNA nuclease
MQFWLGLVTGLLVGWLTEWLFGWRRRDPAVSSADVALFQELDSVRRPADETDPAGPSIAPVASSTSQTDPAGPSVAPAEGPRSQIVTPAAKDDLTRIKGIGPVFAERLRQAGIDSFEALAAASPDALRDAVKAAAWQNVDPESWIDEARQLSDAAPT